MRTVEEHLAAVLDGVEPLEPIDVGLGDVRGCVLAEDITAPWPLPPFDNSSMDGYAVRTADLADAADDAPVLLDVIEDLPAGHRPTRAVTAGTAVRIMTGAPLPEGADAVVPVEGTDAGVHAVKVTRQVEPGAFIRRAGDDVAAEETVMRAGQPLGPRQVALLAAVGRGSAVIRPRPRIVVLSTGSELVPAGQPLAPGLIPDSNSLMLAAAAFEAGAVPYRVGPVRDDEETLLDTLEDQLVRADLVITTGGVSAGAYDTVKAVLSRLGTVEFVRVAMQPGMPQGHGRLGPDETPIFTLPGNPVSAYVSFEIFVRPVIRRMLGFRQVHRPAVRARCLEGFTSPEGKMQFARGTLGVADGRYVVRPVGGQGSHVLGGLARSDALIAIPPAVTTVKAGSAVTVLRLDVDG
ncbi:MAG: molybdopterin molybdenumtransferase MoeA [Actinomycetota bacterium]|nr:MAG: molybdopterin molybdenumtransferase MoeA [Actinomycetota bacterium]